MTLQFREKGLTDPKIEPKINLRGGDRGCRRPTEGRPTTTRGKGEGSWKTSS
jgi:hypothetical protein